MEKLIYLLWPKEDESLASFNAALLGKARQDLTALGVERLKMNVTDADVAPGQALFPPPPDEQPSAMVSFWLNAAHARAPYERALSGFAERIAGYAVAESTVLPHRDTPVDGVRSPGFAQIALLKARPDLSLQEYLGIWLDTHTEIGVETQETLHYNQNIVIRALTPDAPALSSIVEESFPAAAMTDPLTYWKADGSAETQAVHYAREMESCARFLDLPSTRVLITSEYRFGGWRDPARGWHERE